MKIGNINLPCMSGFWKQKLERAGVSGRVTGVNLDMKPIEIWIDGFPVGDSSVLLETCQFWNSKFQVLTSGKETNWVLWRYLYFSRLFVSALGTLGTLFRQASLSETHHPCWPWWRIFIHGMVFIHRGFFANQPPGFFVACIETWFFRFKIHRGILKWKLRFGKIVTLEPNDSEEKMSWRLKLLGNSSCAGSLQTARRFFIEIWITWGCFYTHQR